MTTQIQRLKARVQELEDALTAHAKEIVASQIWLGTGGVKYVTIVNGKVVHTYEEYYEPAGLSNGKTKGISRSL